MLPTIIIILIAIVWLGFETRWMTIRLLRFNIAIPSINIDSLLKMAIGMVFLAIGFILMPLKHMPFPAVLISPSGIKYYMFNANQAKHICHKYPTWKWKLTNVDLISPIGNRLTVNMNGIQAERICRKHGDWAWEEPQ